LKKNRCGEVEMKVPIAITLELDVLKKLNKLTLGKKPNRSDYIESLVTISLGLKTKKNNTFNRVKEKTKGEAKNGKQKTGIL
jgi:hypothetical protein